MDATGKATALDAAASDSFGHSVSIYGDTAIVGAPYADLGGISTAGAAYVFTRSGELWIQQEKLTASDATYNDRFGISVSLYGDTAIVGAYIADAGAVSGAGAAYVFTCPMGVWTQQEKLIASDAAALDRFGFSVSIYGDTAIVGAYVSDPSGLSGAGAAYLYSELPTLVEMESFIATPLPVGIILEWETASEMNNAGFHIWRGIKPDGFYARITDAMIPAEGGPTWGAEYTYEDWDVETGTTYFYQLEDIDTAGVRTFHGPASAWPGVANIQAGDRDEFATATGDQPVSVKVAVQASDYAGTPVEYWLAADTPFGWYSYGAQGWKPGISPGAVGPLADVAPLKVVSFPLSPGWYTFYLAVDDQINGQPDLTWLDSVEVEVE